MDQTTISETLKKITDLETERNRALLTFREIQDKIIELQKFLIYGGYYEGAGTAVFVCKDLYKIIYTKNIISYLEMLRRHSIAPVNVYMFLREKRISYLPPFEKHINGGWYRLEEMDLAEISSTESDIFNRYIEETTGLLDADILAVETCATKDKTKVILDIVKELSEKNSGKISREEVIECAKIKLNLNREKIDQTIDCLRRNGDIFEPRPGFIVVMEDLSNKIRINISQTGGGAPRSRTAGHASRRLSRPGL
jgi:hypothetical protein